jgi:hypothetical protein
MQMPMTTTTAAELHAVRFALLDVAAIFGSHGRQLPEASAFVIRALIKALFPQLPMALLVDRSEHLAQLAPATRCASAVASGLRVGLRTAGARRSSLLLFVAQSSSFVGLLDVVAFLCPPACVIASSFSRVRSVAPL